MQRQSANIEVEATMEELFDIVTDMEAYPEWVDGLEEVTVLEENDDGLPLRAEMLVDAMLKKLRYVLVYEYDQPCEVSWVSEEGGDVRHIEGAYRFEDLGDGTTLVTYELGVDPGFTVPGFMLRTAEKKIASAALNGLKDRAEA